MWGLRGQCKDSGSNTHVGNQWSDIVFYFNGITLAPRRQ